jgi:hypothetical protein
MATTVQVVFDCAAPGALGAFWAAALRYVAQSPPDGFATWDDFLASLGVPEDERDTGYAIVDPAGVGPRVYFQQVPEPKAAKNRLHLDLNVGAGPSAPLEQRRQAVEAEAARLVELGATLVRREEDEGFHIEMVDPEGNEFDVM